LLFVVVDAALEANATVIQCVMVALLIGLPLTCTTASLGIPPPHAARHPAEKKTAPSAAINLTGLLNTTRAL
jgi:hypothetical protein